MKLEYDTLDSLPENLKDLKYRDIKQAFPRPTLIHLKGKVPEPLFLSVALHGNEDVGFEVLKQLAAHYNPLDLPRSLSVFIGNVDAAEKGLRRLHNQKDYNRIWRDCDSPEGLMAQEIREIMFQKRIYASIDLHNNSGDNPMYACINSLDKDFLKLASGFSNKIVYFENPNTCQSMAFAQICPSVTLECGPSYNEVGPQRAFEFIKKVLEQNIYHSSSQDLDSLRIFHTLGRITIEGTQSLSFTEHTADICLPKEFDSWNFTELKKGTCFATSDFEHQYLFVRDEDGRNLSDHFFERRQKNYYLKNNFIPAMLTMDLDVIKKDCLGYFMTQIELPTTST